MCHVTLQHTATVATHCNTLHHTFHHTLQHTYAQAISRIMCHVTHVNKECLIFKCDTSHIGTSHIAYTNVPRHTATHCNTLQHIATHIISHTETHIYTNHIAYTNSPRHTHKRRMSHIQMRHITHICPSHIAFTNMPFFIHNCLGHDKYK